MTQREETVVQNVVVTRRMIVVNRTAVDLREWIIHVVSILVEPGLGKNPRKSQRKNPKVKENPLPNLICSH